MASPYRDNTIFAQDVIKSTWEQTTIVVEKPFGSDRKLVNVKSDNDFVNDYEDPYVITPYGDHRFPNLWETSDGIINLGWQERDFNSISVKLVLLRKTDKKFDLANKEYLVYKDGSVIMSAYYPSLTLDDCDETLFLVYWYNYGLYFTRGDIDGATGKTLWRFDPPILLEQNVRPQKASIVVNEQDGKLNIIYYSGLVAAVVKAFVSDDKGRTFRQFIVSSEPFRRMVFDIYETPGYSFVMCFVDPGLNQIKVDRFEYDNGFAFKSFDYVHNESIEQYLGYYFDKTYTHRYFLSFLDIAGGSTVLNVLSSTDATKSFILLKSINI